MYLRFIFSWIISVVIIFGTFVPSQTAWSSETNETSFLSGIESYQKGQFDEALKVFEKLAVEKPKDIAVLTNLALTHYQLGQIGYSLAFARKVLRLDPGNSQADQLVRFILKNKPPQDIPHQIDSLEMFKTEFLDHFSFFILLIITIFFFYFSAWSWISYTGKRRRAYAEETILPGFPFFSILLSLIASLFIFMTILKWLDQQQQRGTLVIAKESARTSPNEQSPELFELFEGNEVLIRRSKDEWLQITFPGASTGWVKKSSLEVY